MQICLFVFAVFISSFPNNYWDKFVKRKVGVIFVYSFMQTQTINPIW